jgi:hypothetical protein
MVCVLAAALCSAAPAAAQGVPFSGLFGNPAKGQHSLEARGGAFGTWDDNLLARGPFANDPFAFDPRLQAKGLGTGFESNLNYGYRRQSRGRSKSSFQFGAQAAVQEFSPGSSVDAFWIPNYGVNAGVSSNLTPKISFNLGGSAAYAPYYLYAPFLRNPGAPASTVSADSTAPADTADSAGAPTAATSMIPDVGPVGTDAGFGVSSQWVSTLSANTSITDQFTKRSAVTADFSINRAQIFGQTKIDTRLAHAQFTHKLTRKLGLHLGYGIQLSDYTSESVPNVRTENHLIDFGVDYGDGISFGRHYTLSFSTGVSGLQQNGTTAFRLNGSATLARSIGRTWSASIGGVRDTQYVVGIRQPLLTDAANVGVGGQIVPRLHFSAGGYYMRGLRAFVDSEEMLVTKSASAKLTLGLTQHIGLYTQFSYYRYDIPAGFFLDFAFPPNFNRRSATFGITFWAPIINRQAPRQP